MTRPDHVLLLFKSDFVVVVFPHFFQSLIFVAE